MSGIKSLLKGISEHCRRLKEHFPFTASLVVLVAVTAALFIDQDGSLGRFVENKGIPFLILWGIGTYFAETYWRDRKSVKWCGILAAAALSALSIHLTGSSSDPVSETAAHYTAAYVIILISLGIYRNYRDAGMRFDQYCIRVVHGLSRLAIVCAIAALGIVLVMAVFVTLIMNNTHGMLILRIEFLVLGCLVGCGLLDAQIRLDQDLPRFFVVIVKYLLMILLLAAFAIIYGYILKIIVTRIVPSNEIFRILSALFLIGLPIWTMAGTFEADSWPAKISKLLPFIFIPFLFLQGYAIRERIVGFGLTPSRYLCIALMVFEILYIIVFALRKGETGIMLPVIALMALICLVVPYVNMFSISNRSQKTIFDRYISAEFTELSSEEQSDLTGAYYYLVSNAAGKAMLEDIDPEKIDAIRSSGKSKSRDYEVNTYIRYDVPAADVDISGFAKLTQVESKAGSSGTYDPKNVMLYDHSGDMRLSADLSGFIDRCLAERAQNPTGTLNFPGKVELEDGNLLWITSLSATVSQKGDVIRLSAEAIYLENPE